METLLQDLRHSLRTLRRSPGFAAAVTLTLAVGIGANTAIFSIVNQVLLRPLPYPDPQELRMVTPVLHPAGGAADTLGVWSYPMYEAFRRTEHGFDGLAAYTPNPGSYNLSGAESPQRVRVEMVSAGYFPLLGINASRGRTFLPEEDAVPGAAPVALLAYGLWERSYGADPAVVGREISLNSIPFTVVGVLPQGFTGLSGEADVWVPMTMAPALTFPRRLEGALSFWHNVIARAPAGEEGSFTEARLATSARLVEEVLPLEDAFGPVSLSFAALPLRGALGVPGAGVPLGVLMGAMGFLLLIVCANSANLLLTRAARRRREIGVRLALGAGRGRVVRQLMVESIVLALLGGAMGAVIAVLGVELLKAIAPPGASGPTSLRGASLDGRVWMFNFGIAGLTGVGIGVFPALRSLGSDLRATLAGSGRSVAGHGRSRAALVCVELALAAVLLTGAGLMLRTLVELHSVPLGFEPEGVLTASVELPRQTYSEEQVVLFLDEVRRRLDALPGVHAASAAYCLPLGGRCDKLSMEVQGEARPPDAPGHAVWANLVDGAYFRTLGIPLISGRGFTSADRSAAPRVAIVNQAAAEAYWPGRSPLGERIQLSVGWEDWAEVVGVVGDIRRETVREPGRPGVYVPYSQMTYNSAYLVVHTAGDPLDRIGAIREVVRSLDPTLPLWDIQTMEERIGGAVAPTLFSAILLTMAAGLATLLSVVGVFGVVAFSVAGRTREFGLRMALGARDGDVLWLVLRQGLTLALAGLGLGLVASLGLTRLLASQLYGVAPIHPGTLGLVTALLLLAVLVAAWFPARRAARINPLDALRHE